MSYNKQRVSPCVSLLNKSCLYSHAVQRLSPAACGRQKEACGELRSLYRCSCRLLLGAYTGIGPLVLQAVVAELVSGGEGLDGQGQHSGLEPGEWGGRGAVVGVAHSSWVLD